MAAVCGLKKTMEDENLKSLRSEYAILSSIAEKYWVMPYSVIPLAVTIAGALTVYGNASNGIAGIFGCYVMVLLVAWQSLIHSSLNVIGLRLVELECRINAAIKVTNEDGLRWNSYAIGEGIHFPGYKLATSVVIVWGVMFFICASILGWTDVKQRWGQHWLLSAAVIAAPAILIAILLRSIVKVENRIRADKLKILQKFSSAADPPASSP